MDGGGLDGIAMEGRIDDSPWCLFLDVDGTLLELAATPDGVQVDLPLLTLLERASHSLGGAVALISGRTVAELDRLFAPVRWPAAGVHGLERRDAAGDWHATENIDRAAIERARDRLQELAACLPGTVVEDKGIAVAVHYRQAPQHRHELHRQSRAIAREAGTGLRLLEGSMVFEVRPAGATKVDAIRAFLGEPPFAGRRPIFLGDDITDAEALLDVERSGGLSVAVGDRVSGMLRFASPRDVRVFLQDLAERGSPSR